MTDIIVRDGLAKILVGDVIARLADLPDDSVDCVVTSPPYWGLRDYGVEGQLGMEPTLAEHITAMVAVFEAIKRVIKPTATVWMNYGDCYATTPNGRPAADVKAAGKDDRTFRDKPFSTIGDVLKPKDLCMLPNRVAIALQEAGWWVRSEVVWGKTNPMPDSSGHYRPSTSHEKIFMLTKAADADCWRARDTGEMSFSPDLEEHCPLKTKPHLIGPRWIRVGYYYSSSAGMVGMTQSSEKRLDQEIEDQMGSDGAHAGSKPNGPMKAVSTRTRETPPRHKGHINHQFLNEVGRGDGRLLRNYEPAAMTVWSMATHSFTEAHFATFPPELVERCLTVGCPEGGTVLDPFGGAGTTALVALRMDRTATLIELNPEYAQMAAQRIERDFMGADERARHAAAAKAKEIDAGPLFQGATK